MPTAHSEMVASIQIPAGSAASPAAVRIAEPFRGQAPPKTILGFVLSSGGWHQAALLVLSTAVFLLIAAPLELQRRIVNASIVGGNYRLVFWLAAGYAAVALLEGLIKLVLNVYRSWISERAVCQLREWFYSLVADKSGAGNATEVEGVELSVILSETEPVGSIVGIALSEPILQGGLLISLFGYMLYLQPWLAMMSVLTFGTQVLFVPLMQRAINRIARARVQTLREVSVAIVADTTTANDASAQGARIRHVFGLNMRIFRIRYVMNFLMNQTNHLGIAFVLALGGWFAVNGKIEIGTVVAFISGLGKVNEPWGELVGWYRDLAVAQVKYRLIADALEAFAGRSGEASASSVRG